MVAADYDLVIIGLGSGAIVAAAGARVVQAGAQRKGVGVRPSERADSEHGFSMRHALVIGSGDGPRGDPRCRADRARGRARRERPRVRRPGLRAGADGRRPRPSVGPPGFFILGAKSYGRNSNFLLRIGWQQVDDVFEKLT